MDSEPPKTLVYRRANFTTHLPLDYLYSAQHFWISPMPGDEWRVGLTKFGVRKLGEMVDHAFQAVPGAAVQLGQVIGWVEGFKAISDLHALVEGEFLGGNPALKQKITLINRDPYGVGWLYAVKGRRTDDCLDAHGYGVLLDNAIDCILRRQQHNEC